MAEINIERKKNIWPWIIGLLVLLLLIWGVTEMMDNDDDAYAPVPAATSPTTDPATAAPDATIGDAASDTTVPPSQ